MREICVIFLKIFYLFTKPEQNAKFFVNLWEFLRFYFGGMHPGAIVERAPGNSIDRI